MSAPIQQVLDQGGPATPVTAPTLPAKRSAVPTVATSFASTAAAGRLLTTRIIIDMNDIAFDDMKIPRSASCRPATYKPVGSYSPAERRRALLRLAWYSATGLPVRSAHWALALHGGTALLTWQWRQDDFVSLRRGATNHSLRMLDVAAPVNHKLRRAPGRQEHRANERRSPTPARRRLTGFATRQAASWSSRHKKGGGTSASLG